MKLLKKNQVIIYAIAVMLMVVGYLNYTTRTGEALETSSSEVNESNIGDARLVSSNPVEENTLNETNTVSQELSNNETENELVNETSSDIAQETSSSSNNSDDYFTHIQSLTQIIPDSSIHQHLLTYTLQDQENTLYVEIEILYPGSQLYQIKTWKITPSNEWDMDQSMDIL